MRDTSVTVVGPKGRLVIPATIRRTLGLREGTELVAMIDGDAVVLLPRVAIKARLRSMFAAAPSMRDELIAERRIAVAEESNRP